MARVTTIQSSFLLGEISPRSLGNTTDPLYPQALYLMENALPMPQGGAQKRVGTQRIAYTTGRFPLESTGVNGDYGDAITLSTLTARKVQFVPFRTSDGKRWLIVLTDGSYREWGVLDVTNNILRALPMGYECNVALGSPITNTWLRNDLKNTGATYYAAPTNINNVQYYQSGDVLFLAGDSIPPITIRYLKTGHYDLTPANNFYIPLMARWDSAFYPTNTLADNAEFHQAIPFLEPHQNNNYGRGSITFPLLGGSGGGGVYVIGDNVTLTFSVAQLDSTWINTAIKFTDVTGTTTGTVIISAVASGTSCTARVVQGPVANALPTGGVAYGTAANTYWQESAWSLKNGYPAFVTGYGQRVLYGGTVANPNRVWVSAVGDVDELDAIPYAQDASFSSYLDDNSRAFYFDIQGADKLQWAVSGKRVFIGAKNKEFVLYAPNGNFGPDDYIVDEATSNGGLPVQPLRHDSEVLFAQRSGQRIRSVIFSFQEDDYKSEDLTRLAEHITRPAFTNITEASQVVQKIIAMAGQYSPNKRIWAIDSNGGLLSLTYDRVGKVMGWARHKLGGTPISGGAYGSTYPTAWACTSLPSYDNEADELYLAVKRRVAGSNVLLIEKIGPYYDLYDLYTHDYINSRTGFAEWLRARPVFMDCCQASSQSPATTTHTFSNMASETVAVLADGQYLGTKTLSGAGVLTLDRAYKEVLIGYNYETRLVLTDIEIAQGQQTIQGKFKILPDVFLRFYRTSYCLIKEYTQSTYQTIQFVPDSHLTDSYVPLFSGDKRANIGNIGRNMKVDIKHNVPLPFELLAVIFNIEVS